ncbi:MAG: SEC-C metal-binding domain-containing protein, partial [Muribaculaceae bacterium]
KGDDQLFIEFRPNVEKVVNAQRKLVTELLADAKSKMTSDDKEVRKEGTLSLYRAYKGLPKSGALIKYLSQDGVKPQMMETESHYMQDNSREMFIVTDPLYFVIDEKNNSVELTDKGIDILTGNTDDPLFFVLPDIASQLSELEIKGLTPDELQAQKDDLMQAYAIKAERVHTVNQLFKAYTLFALNTEYVVDDNKVKIVDEQTGRIMEGRRYSDGLHQAIEAKEGVKVEAATQTFATITLQNYFRMYHKLSGMTGTAETEAGELWDIYKLDVVTIPTNRPISRVDSNDRVYKTKKEKYNAVIDEIQKMVDAGRPVLVGTTSVEISELLSRMLLMRKIPHNVLNAKLHQREADIVAQAGKTGTVTIATNMAGRGTDIKLTQEVREAGGLAIIGTERHESRRVDRQLRGRAGRQGDPGSSVFYVSFEDTVMRLFATDRVVKMLDRLGLKEGEMIEANMVTKSIENAQKRVEENNFGIRKHLLEYDDVMNAQRNVVYTKRHHALMGERIGIDIMNMLYDSVENIISSYSSQDDYPEMALNVSKTFAIEMPFDEMAYRKMRTEDMTDSLYKSVITAFKRKSERMAEVANPIIKQIVEERNGKGLIRVPITDGKRVFGITVDIDEAYESQCKSISKAWQKSILLMGIDEAWKEHLRELDQLRQSSQNASYEQKDPLLIYKLESFNLFKDMMNTMNGKTIATLMRGQIPVQEAAPVQPAAPEMRQDYSRYSTRKEQYPGENAQRAAASQQQGEQQRREPIKVGPKVGRNDPCPCGSGKKFKNCHGREV